MCVTDVPAATATCYLLGSAVTRVGLLAMAASIQFDPLEVPRYLTEIHIVLPLHIHVIIYGDANVDAPTLCICNAAELSFSNLVLGTFKAAQRRS